MMNARKKIEELDAGEMTEELFEAHNAKDEEAEKFDYGKRDISRKPLETELNYFLPYYSLYLLEDEYSMVSTLENSSFNNFIFVTGKAVDARLNFVCSILRKLRIHLYLSNDYISVYSCHERIQQPWWYER